MLSRRWWLFAGLVAIGVVLTFLGVYAFQVAAKQRDAMASFSSTIELGMSRDEVDGKCRRACRDNSGWRYSPNVEGFGVSVALVESPLTFGAKNWVVFFVFENDVVAAVLVRTSDTRRLKPHGAPQDRIHGTPSWLAAFRQR
jgi:hypothetical protein